MASGVPLGPCPPRSLCGGPGWRHPPLFDALLASVPSHPPPPGSQARGLRATSGSFGLRVKTEPLSCLDPTAPHTSHVCARPSGLTPTPVPSPDRRLCRGGRGGLGRGWGGGLGPELLRTHSHSPAQESDQAASRKDSRGAPRCPRPSWGLGTCRVWLLGPLSRFAEGGQPCHTFPQPGGVRSKPPSLLTSHRARAN